MLVLLMKQKHYAVKCSALTILHKHSLGLHKYTMLFLINGESTTSQLHKYSMINKPK